MSDEAIAPKGNAGFLGTVERVGNKLPHPAVLFIALLFIVWGLSRALSYLSFDVIDPRSGEALTIRNLLTAFVNIFVGSASGKWGLLAPIFVPMLMSLGISPDLTQAVYRVGDSSTNIITPLMPYFPLVVVYCQRYVKNTGIGTLTAMMLPYSIWFLLIWTLFLLPYYAAGLPLGFAASYTYPPG